jgi:phosphate/sulfate permease
VAATIGKGIIDPKIVDHYLIFGALVGAISWNIITWIYGIPSSSSHALIGGLAGAAVAKGGVHTLVASGLIKTAFAIVLSPALGFFLGTLLMVAVSWMCARQTPRRVDRWFRRLQLVSAGLYSLGHGGNDAQKTMGIIWMLLIAGGSLQASDDLPLWVVFACYGTISLGTLFGGWRIVKTMGQRITKLKPVSGFCAETGGAITLFLATAHRSTGCPPRTRSPAPWSASGRCKNFQQCGGGWQATSCGHGYSPFHAPPLLPPWRGGLPAFTCDRPLNAAGRSVLAAERRSRGWLLAGANTARGRG